MILRRVARPLLAAIFVSSGIETLRNPKPRIQAAQPVLDKIPDQVHEKIPDQVPTDTETLVKVDAAVKIGAGVALGLGKFPRLSSFLLAGSLVPTTAASHRFWECEDPKERAEQQAHFLKNLGLLGGLLIASADTHGKPSLNWRARRAARTATGAVLTATGGAQKTVGAATGKVQEVVGDVAGSVQKSVGAATSQAQKTAVKAQKRAAKTTGKAQKAASKATGRAVGKAQDAAGTVWSKLPV